MAKKSKSKAKQHTRDLISGMKQSNAQSNTPISSLYAKTYKVGSSKTSPFSRGKGTLSPSRSHAPGKFLLSVTNPGDEPQAPEPVETVMQATGFEETPIPQNYEGYNADTRRWIEDEGGDIPEDQTQEQYEQDLSSYNSATIAYNNYQTALGVYNNANDLYQTNLADYNVGTAANVQTSSQYNQDVKKFLAGLRGKATKKQVKHMRGSRNTRTRLGGARG